MIEESKQFQCNILSFIEINFVLPKELARKYTCLIFLMAGRFNAVSKKRFQNITCQQLESCAAATMACLIPDLTTFTIHWGCPLDCENVERVFSPSEYVLHLPVTNRTSSTMLYQVPPSPLSTIYSQDDNSVSMSRLNSNRSISTLQPQRAGSVSGFILEDPVELESPSVNVLLSNQSKDENSKSPLASSPIDSPSLPILSQQSSLNAGYQTPLSNSPWPGIWKLISVVDTIDPDKQLTHHLRELSSWCKGDILDAAVTSIRITLSQVRVNLTRKFDNSSGKLKNILKSLLQIGGNLSHSREYRDLFEDIVIKIGDPLHEEMNLSRQEMNRLLVHCNALVPATRELLIKKLSTSQPAIPTSSSSIQGRESTSSTIQSHMTHSHIQHHNHHQQHGQHHQRSIIERKINSIEKDWIRFVTCCRICLWNFYA